MHTDRQTMMAAPVLCTLQLLSQGPGLQTQKNVNEHKLTSWVQCKCFEVLTVTLLKMQFFWDVTLSQSMSNYQFFKQPTAFMFKVPGSPRYTQLQQHTALNITTFCDVTLCHCTRRYWCSREMQFLLLQGQAAWFVETTDSVTLEDEDATTWISQRAKQHSITSQQTSAFSSTGVRTSNLITADSWCTEWSVIHPIFI